MIPICFSPVLIMCVVLLCAVPNAFPQAVKRNLNEYKQGPSFDLQNYYLPQGNQKKASQREFLWELWTTRTKDFCEVISYTREGAPGKCKFFVEPNAKGGWVVVSECKYSECPYSSAKSCRRYLNTTFTSSYDLVQRIVYGEVVVGPSGPRRQQVQIADSEDRNPLNFVLILESSTSAKKSEW